MISETHKKMLHNLFAVVKEFSMGCCGDGGGYIVSENYLDYALLFEEWNKSDNFYNQKFEDKDHVSFCRDQEAVVFCHERPSIIDSIIVEIY